MPPALRRTTIALAVSGTLCAPLAAHAQIATDGTLGAAQALTGPNFAIPAHLGRQAGANLFHSFATFSVPSGGSATFSGPTGIGNVISRVTGPDASNINGTLRSSIVGANLYLINPKGILFGANARLDLTGSFYASTADYLRMADGTRFDAVAVPPPVLSVAEPAAFGFLGPSAGAITVSRSRWDVPAGVGLNLIGGNVSIDRGFLRTRAADIVAGGVTAGEVARGAGGLLAAGANAANVSITTTTVGALGSGAAAPGRIVIAGGQLTVSSSTFSSTNATAADAQSLVFQAQGDLSVRAATVTSSNRAAGRGADLVFSGRSVTLERNTQLLAETDGSGPGGAVDLHAQGTLTLRRGAGALIDTVVYARSWGTAPAGRVTVTADAVQLERSTIASEILGSGSANPIVVRARTVDVGDRGKVLSGAYAGSSGNGGDIDMAATERVSVVGGTIRSEALGVGRGGDLAVVAPDIQVTGGGVETVASGAGRGGDVLLEGATVRVAGNGAGGGLVQSLTGGGSSGDGGNITVRASGAFTLGGGGTESNIAAYNSRDGSTGHGGNVTIESPNILLVGPAMISTHTNGAGNAGDITIRTHDMEMRAGTAIFTDVAPWSTGQGGNATLEGTGRLTMATTAMAPFDHWILRPDTSSIGAFTAGPGRSGDVTITIPEIYGELRSNIVSFAQGGGDGGNLTINAQRVKLGGNSLITARAHSWADWWGEGKSNAGNITLNIGESLELSARDRAAMAAQFGAVAMDHGGIQTSAFTHGNAGTITVNAPLVILDDARIQATTSRSGSGGQIALRVDDLILKNGGQIEATALPGSSGNAGSIVVNARNRIDIAGMSPIDGGFAGVSAETRGTGRGGDIILSAPRILVDDGSRISATSAGAGQAGSVTVIAPDRLELFGGSSISTEALQSDGGNITILAGNRVHLRDSEISTSVGSGQGAGGNILIDPTFVILENSRIVANAFGGPGGNITIIADYFLNSPGSLVEASSALGVPGTVQISTPTLDPNLGLKPLNAKVVDASAFLRESCAARAASGAGSSSLVGVGRGGLAASPGRFAASTYFAAPDPGTVSAPGSTGLRLSAAQRARLNLGCRA